MMESDPMYPELIEGQDFIASNEQYPKGSRTKKIVYLADEEEGCRALFKYCGINDKKFRVGEDCSEKIAYELAKVLGYPSARIELAKGANGEPGILSYLFTNGQITLEHASDFVPDIGDTEKEKHNYTIEKIHDALVASFEREQLFFDFIKILLFDVLVDEGDRHGDNWGIIEKANGEKAIAPIYDTSACLLRDLANEKYYNNKFLNKKDPLKKLLSTGKANIYKEEVPEKYNHFEMLEYLLYHYRNAVIPEIKKLKQLTDDRIEGIIGKMPKSRMKGEHKHYLTEYIKLRRDLIISKGEQNECSQSG